MQGLDTVLDVEHLLEGKVLDGGRIFAGVSLAGLPVGVRASVDGKTPPAALDLDEVCAFGEALKAGAMLQPCVGARAQRDDARARAAAKAAKADAGGPPLEGGAVDAGVSP